MDASYNTTCPNAHAALLDGLDQPYMPLRWKVVHIASIAVPALFVDYMVEERAYRLLEIILEARERISVASAYIYCWAPTASGSSI